MRNFSPEDVKLMEDSGVTIGQILSFDHLIGGDLINLDVAIGAVLNFKKDLALNLQSPQVVGVAQEGLANEVVNADAVPSVSNDSNDQLKQP